MTPDPLDSLSLGALFLFYLVIFIGFWSGFRIMNSVFHKIMTLRVARRLKKIPTNEFRQILDKHDKDVL
jgi:hypothetical protein